MVFSELNLLDKAMNLAYYELLGDAEMMNTELNRYQEITVADIKKVSDEIFTEGNSNTMHYFSKN